MKCSLEEVIIEDKKEKDYIKTLVYTLLGLLLLLLAFGAYVNREQIAKYSIYIVQSGSMRPALREGDLIFTYKSDDYSKNDIITFKSLNKQVITHRLIDVLDNGNYRTKGDYNSVVDIDEVSKKRVLGEYLFKIPLIGYLFNFIKSDVGLILLVFVPCTILIYEEIKKIKSEIKKLKSKK
ncbi:MAG TPA: signal peptidase I [Candidatus Dojkabacteria bacterium]|nr:signal peptidase I [Candidatus Dojkabacteria bacterium]